MWLCRRAERQHSEAALAAAAADADDPSDRTHAAVRWLRQAGHSPLYTEDEPYEDDAGTAVRVASFLSWLAARPEKEVLVSTHCMWLHTLFGRSPPMVSWHRLCVQPLPQTSTAKPRDGIVWCAPNIHS